MINKATLAAVISGLFILAVIFMAADKDEDQIQKVEFEVKVQPTGKYTKPDMSGVSEDRVPDSNDLLIRDVRDKLRGSYKNYNINIHVMDGVVTLTGTVKTLQDKDKIEKDIKKIDGVKKVDNQLQVKESTNE